MAAVHRPVEHERLSLRGAPMVNFLSSDSPFFIMFDISEYELCSRLLAYGSGLVR